MAASAAAASVAVRSNQVAPAVRSPQIVENNSAISVAEEEELRQIAASADGQVAERTMGLYTEKQEKRGKITKKPWFIIDPRTSSFISYWDGISMLALIFTAIVTVIEVAFIEPSGIDALWIVNRCIDAIFTVDVCLQFLLMYPHAGSSPQDTVRWIHEPDQIAKHYLRTWFTLDIVSIGVSVFDYPIVFESMSGPEEEGDGLRGVKIFRVIRIARLIKLVRLLRSSRIMKRLESRVAINYGYLALVKCLVMLLLAGHWYACFWGLICTFESPKDTWYVEFGYCSYDPSNEHAHEDAEKFTLLAASGNASDEVLAEYEKQLGYTQNYVCKSTLERYTASLYWAIMTITSIGYGDIAAAPNNQFEQAWCIFLMLFGGMIWGSVIAIFCGVIANLDPAGTEFRKTMDDLNSFMALQSLPKEMRVSLRQYFHQTRHLQVARANKALIENMSPMLQGQVVWKINERWLKHVWFLRDAEDKFMVQLSLALHAAVFAPAELCPNGYMYISHRGIALYGGKVLTSGKVWGEDMILSSVHLRSKFAARCMTYVEVYMISRDGLLDLAKNFPPTLKIIRRSSFRLAFRREMIRRAQDSLRERNAAKGVAEKGSAAERLMVQISSKETTAQEERDAQALENSPNLSGRAISLTPLGGAVDAQAVTALTNSMAALEKRMSTQHEALATQLSELAARLDAVLAK